MPSRWAIITILAAVTATPALAYDDVSAKCLIEIATKSNEQHLLTSEEFREKVERRAAAIQSEVSRLWADGYRQRVQRDAKARKQKDLFENGLITQAEYDAFLSSKPYPARLIEIGAAYPQCNFLARYSFDRSLASAVANVDPRDAQSIVATRESFAKTTSDYLNPSAPVGVAPLAGFYSPPATYAPSPPGYTYRPSGGGPVKVRGYTRKDGTYVRPHTRSRPRG